MNALDAEMIEQRDHILNVRLQPRLGLARREELAAQIAADHTEVFVQLAHDRLPGRHGHQAAVEEDHRRGVFGAGEAVGEAVGEEGIHQTSLSARA